MELFIVPNVEQWMSKDDYILTHHPDYKLYLDYPEIVDNKLLDNYKYKTRTIRSREKIEEKVDSLVKKLTGDLSWMTKGHDPYVRDDVKVGRNDVCPCGSSKKYKKCCLTNPKKQSESTETN